MFFDKEFHLNLQTLLHFYGTHKISLSHHPKTSNADIQSKTAYKKYNFQFD